MSIRTKTKLFGEPNSPNTVLAPTSLVPNKYVVGSGGKTLKTLVPSGKSLMYINQNSKLAAFPLNTPNRLVGTDGNGNLTLIVRSGIPSTPPAGRELISEVYGSNISSGAIGSKTITLEPGYWYEVEVAGAGGGGGGGAIADYFANNSHPGKKGGNGGYHKLTFSVLEAIIATLQAGNSGEGGKGMAFLLQDDDYIYTGNNDGGNGGRSPVLYGGVAAKGGNANPEVNTVRAGGNGNNGGAAGGRSGFGGSSTDARTNAGAGGGGANGPYGGAGGKFDYPEDTSYLDSAGGGGGAGGGFGIGGAGGDIVVELAVRGSGGKGYGGGGGGAGNTARTYDDPIYNPQNKRFGAGGAGGGGGSRFVVGDLEILCGGGGGGAGGGNVADADYTEGGNGKNNKNSTEGGGGTGGVGGVGVNTANDVLVNNVSINNNGQNGQPGWVKIWRCV